MPAYNAEKYIGEAIQSVMDQEYVQWELLIINDGSTDATQEVIDRYNDSRIIKFTQENAGVSVARNIGLKNMKGEFFCFLDADDKLPTRSLTARIKCFEDPDIYFVDGKVNRWNESMSQRLSQWSPSFRGNPLEDLMKLTGQSFFGPSWMVRKTEPTFFEVGHTHGEELLLYIKLAQSGGKYDYVEEEVLDYRVHDSSAMSNLVGLGEGYRLINQKTKELGIDAKLVSANQRKIKSIMFKSFLANGEFFKAFKYVIGS